MKPTLPDDSLDELLMAALAGELSPEERARLDARIENEPAVQAAFLEAQAMHDLLEKTNRSAQPDSEFEQRMVSGVRRKLKSEDHRESAWESVLFFWRMGTGLRFRRWQAIGVALVMAALGLTYMVRVGGQVKSVFATVQPQGDFSKTYVPPGAAPANGAYQLGSGGRLTYTEPSTTTTPQGGTIRGRGFAPDQTGQLASDEDQKNQSINKAFGVDRQISQNQEQAPNLRGELALHIAHAASKIPVDALGVADTSSNISPTTTLPPLAKPQQFAENQAKAPTLEETRLRLVSEKKTDWARASEIDGMKKDLGQDKQTQQATSQPADSRKLIRNAKLDLEVASFQETIDKVTAATKAAGGYVDTSHSEKGGNGKLQGTVVVKVLPQNLDAFLLKLRELGQVQNQSVSTDDVTKDYFDTQARLTNSQRMETQLQELLKRENGKVSDLLQVERELGRVRGDIESMQGQLKLYDFQVQYATVTMNVAEEDLNRAAAYLLKETDNFSLFATNVEDTFAKARHTAEDFKAQVLVANLNHNSGSDVSAEMTLSVAPDKIEPFLAEVRSMGRVANFTRDTQRVAKDGGDTNQPADQTQTEQDKVTVSLSIRSDDESRKQVALTVVTKAVDEALEKAKSAALAATGTEILSSSLNKAPEGQSTALLSVRVPGKAYDSLVTALKSLGRVGSLSIQREDNAGPGANGDDAPVIVSLSLTDSDTPLQVTEMAVRADDVDSSSQQIKRDAATAGVEVKASSFERSPDGLEQAQLTFRMPMAKYAGFLDSLKKLGKVESLSVQRNDRPDQTRADDTAPVEVSLQLHNQRALVADDDGIFATLRRTFSDGASALFSSVRTIGVLVAFVLPWAVALAVVAWVGRRIYVWRKK